MANGGPRLLLGAVGAVLVVVAVPLGHLLTTTPVVRRGELLAHSRAEYLEGSLQTAVHGGLAVLAVPALLLLFACMVVATAQVSVRSAAVLMVTTLAANLCVQACKYPPLSQTALILPLDPLSGHAGVVGGVCLGWLLVAPAGLRLVSAVSSAAAIAGIGMGVVLAGWHTMSQVVTPLAICTGWALLGAAVLRPGRTSDDPGRRHRGWAAGLAVIGLVSIVTVSMLLPTLPAGDGNDLADAMALSGLAVLGAALVCVAAVLAVAAGSQPSDRHVTWFTSKRPENRRVSGIPAAVPREHR